MAKKATKPVFDFGPADGNGYRNAEYAKLASATMMPTGSMSIKPVGSRHGWQVPKFVTLAKLYATDPAFATWCDEQSTIAVVEKQKRKPSAQSELAAAVAAQTAALTAVLNKLGTLPAAVVTGD